MPGAMPTLPPAAADRPRTAVLDLAGWRTGALLQALAQAQTQGQGQALDYVVVLPLTISGTDLLAYSGSRILMK